MGAGKGVQGASPEGRGGWGEMNNAEQPGERRWALGLVGPAGSPLAAIPIDPNPQLN